MSNYKILKEPLSMEEMQSQMEKNQKVQGVVEVELSEIVNRDLESFLDLISDKLTNTWLLSGTDYELVGHKGNTLHLKVTGDAGLVLEGDYTDEV